MEDLQKDFDGVEEKIKTFGKVILIKNNCPKYVITAIECHDAANPDRCPDEDDEVKKMTLWDAMEQVLRECPTKTMHAKALARKIADEGLYFMRNGKPADPVQVRTRAGHAPDRFECLPGNNIKLKKTQ